MTRARSERIAIIASLRFSPAFASHMIAYARALRELGLDIVFALHEKYLGFSAFDSIGEVVPATSAKEWLATNRAEIAVFANASIGNATLARRMRQCGIQVWYVFHEPDAVRNHLREGLKEIVRYAVAQLTSILMVRASTGVFVPSLRARELYERYFQGHNGNVKVLRLLCEDAAADMDFGRGETRKFFAFIGSASKAHNFEAFVDFAKAALRTNCGFPFLIATRSDLTALLDRDSELRAYVEQGKIRIRHGKVLPDEEMDCQYRQSFCVWNAYQCCTQSGVLARAFMNGTPVLANRTGSFPEFVIPGANGEFLESKRDLQEILEATARVRGGLLKYVAQCRASFLALFHYRAGLGVFAEIEAESTPPEADIARPAPMGQGEVAS